MKEKDKSQMTVFPVDYTTEPRRKLNRLKCTFYISHRESYLFIPIGCHVTLAGAIHSLERRFQRIKCMHLTLEVYTNPKKTQMFPYQRASVEPVYFY